jgi:hypothetical protein
MLMQRRCWLLAPKDVCDELIDGARDSEVSLDEICESERKDPIRGFDNGGLVGTKACDSVVLGGTGGVREAVGEA